MAFKFYIDGQLTDSPSNEVDLVTNFKRDADLGGFVITQEIQLVYNGNNDLDTGVISGYAYLKSKFESGSCNLCEVVITDQISGTQTNRIYTGVIAVPDMIVSEQEINLSCKIEDNSFYSYIHNNKNIKYNLYSNRTKNNQLITPCQIYEVDMFWSATGVYGSSIGVLYRGYRVFDVLSYIVSAISDNKVSFASDYLTQEVQLFLFDGQALISHDTDPNVLVSFGEIISELFKLKNVGFFIDQTDPDNPILRLEDAEWFFTENTVMTFSDVKQIATSIKTDKIFGTVQVGSEYNPGGSDPIFTFNANQSYFGWKQETYTPLGQCNTATELNLVNSWAISSNAINYQLGGASTTETDRIFCVECDNVDTAAFTATAVDYDIYGNGSARFYNVGLNNVNRVGLHSGNFQAALTNTAAVGTDICHVSLGQDQEIFNVNPGGTGSPFLVEPIQFADEFGGGNYDGGNNWSLVNYDYTTPSAGDYSFSTSMVLEVANCATSTGVITSILYPQGIQTTIKWGVGVTVGIRAYTDGTYTTLIAQSFKTFYTYTDLVYTINVALPIALPSGARVRVGVLSTAERFCPDPIGYNNITGQAIPLSFGDTPMDSTVWVFSGPSPYPGQQNRIIYALEDSYFECNGTPDGGLLLAQPDLTAYKVRLHEFEYDVTMDEFQQILTNPIGQFEFEKDGLVRTGWIEELSHNNQTGRTKVKLISNDATS